MKRTMLVLAVLTSLAYADCKQVFIVQNDGSMKIVLVCDDN